MDQAKVDMVRAVAYHVDITVAEIAVRYLVHVDECYLKDGRPTSQSSLIRMAVNALLDQFSRLEASRVWSPGACPVYW